MRRLALALVLGLTVTAFPPAPAQAEPPPSTQTNAAPSDGADASSSRRYPRAPLVFPRIYVAAAFDLGVGIGVLDQTPSSDLFGLGGKATTRGFAVGGAFSAGVRVSERLAVHGTFTAHRLVNPAVRVVVSSAVGSTDTGYSRTDAAMSMSTLGVGVTVFPPHMVVGATLGFGHHFVDDSSTIGFGGDLMVGYARELGRASRFGAAFATSWMRKPRNADGLATGAFTVGPRVFIAY